MGLYEFFFPEQATAGHLKALREQAALAQRTPASQDTVADRAFNEALKVRIDELEKDLGFVTLVLASLLSSLEENGHLTREQVMRELEGLDPVDGAADGQLDVRLLRKYLGARRDDD